MIHRDTQNQIKALVTKWANQFFEDKEKGTGLKYGYFKKWFFIHLDFNGWEPYELIISLRLDVEGDLPKNIMSVSFPVTVPEKDYDTMAKAITMKLLAKTQEICLSDLTREMTKA